MKRTVRTMMALLLALVICFSLGASALATASDENVSARTLLAITASLSSTRAQARGISNMDENITVSFSLYTAAGVYITSGNSAGFAQTTASAAVNLSSGSYQIIATVCNGIDSVTRVFNFNI